MGDDLLSKEPTVRNEESKVFDAQRDQAERTKTKQGVIFTLASTFPRTDKARGRARYDGRQS